MLYPIQYSKDQIKNHLIISITVDLRFSKGQYQTKKATS
jgi:hypothetical protein